MCAAKDLQPVPVAAIIQVPSDAGLLDMDSSLGAAMSDNSSPEGIASQTNTYTATDELGHQVLDHQPSSEAAISAESQAQLGDDDTAEPTFATAGADSTTQTGNDSPIEAVSAGSPKTRQQLVTVIAGETVLSTAILQDNANS